MGKKALLIGINYIGTRAELKGCINDVINVRKYLKEEHDFKDEEIYFMTEAAEDSKKIPSKKNIIEAFQWLVKDCDKDSKLFLHYSGHGGSTYDQNSDERDRRDETIFPLDGMIVDDDIKKMIVEPLPEGAKLTCIFDCCHSGTVLDLRYNYKVDSNPTRQNFSIDVDKNYKDSKAQVILFSGCMDNQYSADSYEAGQAQGAMTYCFLTTMQKLKSQNKTATYRKVIKNLSVFIKQKGYRQIPQLSSGKFLNLEDELTIL